VALEPGSEQSDLALPDDYKHDHPNEHPEDWGWHGEFGKWTRVAGWFVALVFVLMMTSTHYNKQGTLFLGLSALGIVIGLLYDRQKRKNSWRS
jgi:uncharacterized membrane protein